MEKKRALIAMSGGVDSSVAAMLMLRAGYDCQGALMKLNSNAPDNTTAASNVALKLGLPLHIFDFSEEFTKIVVEKFIKAYQSGETPNPCIVCNKKIKFGALLKRALELNLDYIVTGHYVRTERDASRFLLKKGLDESKDQSYVLYSLTQRQLSRCLFPLGEMSKAQARQYAAVNGLDNAERSDSQDICFIPDGNYVEFITDFTGVQPQKGQFVDSDGKYLCENAGIINYTIGQRRGIGLSMPYPAYVLKIVAEDNKVVIGPKEKLFSNTLTIDDVNLIPFDKLNNAMRVTVKIRYSHTAQPATINQVDTDRIHIEFDSAQRAITRGQAAVIYDGDYVIGGGTIL